MELGISTAPGLPTAETLIGLLASRASTDGQRQAFRFDGRTTTFSDLWRNLNRFAAHLVASGLQRGDRVVLALPNGSEFFFAFYGIQRAGGIAVPAFPGSGIEQVFQIAERCGARIVVLPSPVPRTHSDYNRPRGGRGSFRVLNVAEGPSASGTGSILNDVAFPALAPEDIAYIQYTSGSTGDPKGVILSHANLLTNVRQLIAGMEITPEDIFVSWLPVYHDMGLVLMTMVPFFLGAELILLPAALANVRQWLTEIERNRATFTAAPDFAYRLCLRYMKNSGERDLSSLRVALNAAEPVRARTITDFEATFGLSRVMMPGYGLAEATVGVSMCTPRSKVQVDRRGFVSVGRPFPRIEIAILKNGEIVGSDQVGEILVASPANTRGYFEDSEATSDLFWRGFIRTGDLGYLDSDGHLFVVGREKNIIIQAGRTIAPREVEEVVDAQPFIRYSAAVGVDRGDMAGEQVYVFAELRTHTSPSYEECRECTVRIVQGIHSQLGFRPGRVYLAAPRSIPLTHNGKIRHADLKRFYMEGTLRGRGSLFFPPW